MKNDKQQQIEKNESVERNDHDEMPIKNKNTDHVKTTVDEPGLNQVITNQNELEPGIEQADDE